MAFRWFSPLVAVCWAFGALAPAARAEGDADDFRANCANCHTIGGGRLVGPDLKDVSKRQGRDWLVRFIQDPAGVISSGDPYAARILAEARNVMMAPVAGMTAKRAGLLLDLVDAESKLEKSRFATAGVSDRAFTGLDLARGRDLFRGATALGNGGPACLSCHQAGDAGALGGGRLGPDLSDVVARLGGRKALGAWLMAPPTATMKPLFRGRALDPETEILPILAYLKDVGDRPATPSRTAQRLAFVFAGVGGAAVLLVLLDLAWRRRFRGVRSALVKGAS